MTLFHGVSYSETETRDHGIVCALSFNPSAWRHLIPGQYCAVGGFSTWVFKFEPESAKYFKYV
jgi:hypothetical protein